MALSQGNQAACTDELLARQAQGVARALSSWYCVQPGNRVALCLGSSPDGLVCLVGALWAGATVVIVNNKLGAAELNHVLHDSGATLVIAEAELAVSGVSNGACIPVPLAALVSVAESVSGLAGLMKPVVRRPHNRAQVLYAPGTVGRSNDVLLAGQSLEAMLHHYEGLLHDAVL